MFHYYLWSKLITSITERGTKLYELLLLTLSFFLETLFRSVQGCTGLLPSFWKISLDDIFRFVQKCCVRLYRGFFSPFHCIILTKGIFNYVRKKVLRFILSRFIIITKIILLLFTHIVINLTLHSYCCVFLDASINKTRKTFWAT